MPDDALYSIKLATESVQIALTPSDLGKAQLYTRFNDRRVEEIVTMADEGKAVQVAKATDNLNSNMLAMANITTPDARNTTGSQTSNDLAETTRAAAAPVYSTESYSNVTTPPVTIAPSTKGIPEETVPAPSTTTVIALPLDESYESTSFGLGGGPDKRVETRIETPQELQKLLTDKQIEALLLLNTTLENAPDWLKPQIERAIEIILDGYAISISNLQY
jgi:hypothetical protein